MKKKPSEQVSTIKEFLVFTSAEGDISVDVQIADETVWLSQKLIALLYMVTTPTINEHLKNIYKENELDQNSTIRNFRIVQNEGGREVSREIEHYNLEAIIAVGYRVNSHHLLISQLVTGKWELT